MTDLSPTFDSKNIEIYGIESPFYTPEQLESLRLVDSRVNQQLDWLAQLLGWNGLSYWGNLASNVAQKRHLLTGSFGIYNGYCFPRIKEVRNWDNTVIIEKDERIEVGQIFYLGDYSYELKGIYVEGNDYALSFGTLTDQFLSDIASNKQLKVSIKDSLPDPFNRVSPENSCDLDLIASIDESTNSISLEISTGSDIKLPVVHKALFEGSRVSFNLPLSLTIESKLSSDYPQVIQPTYNFEENNWFLEIPYSGTDAEAKLTYGSSETRVKITKWSFEGGWYDKDIIDNFSGVWGNKGGKLPFHFLFDSLGIHGCDAEKCVSLDPVNVSLPFNSLLDLIYYQKALVSPNPPYLEPPDNQVWWNSDSGALSVYQGKSLNCGPWVEIDYPEGSTSKPTPAYVFADVASFRSPYQPVSENMVVLIENGDGLEKSDGVYGLTGEINVQCRLELVKHGGSSWKALGIEFQNVNDFSSVAALLPGKVPVTITDSTGLSPSNPTYKVKNLNITISEPYPLLISKDPTQGVNEWYISPPSELRYIGDTKLYDNGVDLEGNQLYWEYPNNTIEDRAALIFYYNGWEKEAGEWKMTGEWIPVNSNSMATTPNPVINYGCLKVFCNSVEVSEGDEYRTDDFSFSYGAQDGIFSFHYSPITSKGITNLPTITITDSLTTAFRHDISDFIFSGALFRLNPNPLDTNTPLRVWKTDPLFSVSSEEDIDGNLVTNPLIADYNQGPSDENWERYFLRLSPLHKRDGASWQKVNAICQGFGLWGSPITYERMNGPRQEEEVLIYEDVVLSADISSTKQTMYSEPFIYSNIKIGIDYEEDYGNSTVLPSFDTLNDGYEEATLVEYDPLNTRSTKSGSGDWEGIYLRSAECLDSSGELIVDLHNLSVEQVEAPVMDLSIYKAPPIEGIEEGSSLVDSNHYRIGYSFFTADLSTAEEAVFEIR